MAKRKPQKRKPKKRPFKARKPSATAVPRPVQIISGRQPKTGGRRSDLTNDKAARIVEALTMGSYFNVACGYARVPESTAYSWIERGTKELDRLLALEKTGEKTPEPLPTELPFLEFLEAVQHAESRGEMAAVLTIKSFFKKDWRAAAAFLERRHRLRWGARLELAGDPDAPLTSHVTVYIPDNKRGPKPQGGKDGK